jgi:hypothetical protein
MRKITFLLLISVFVLAACAPKILTEKDLANVKLTEKDLPAGFVQSPDSAVENVAPYTESLQKAFFTTTAAGKIFNTTMFSKDSSDASHGIISFDYFPLSSSEKEQVLTETKKQDVATCCKMLINILQGDETSCAEPDFTSLIAVIPGLDKIAESSLGCSLTIAGDSYFELGYAVNQNVISVIFEGFNQVNPDEKITPLLDLKTILTSMNGKITAAAK